MKQHVIKTCQTAYYELKRISSIRRYLTEEAAKQLITSSVLSRLDYCNSLLMGTPNFVIQPMQKVQNTAARLILRAPRHQNCTPLLQQLHWLPVSERIKYKIARVTTQSQVPLPLIFLSCYTFTVLPALSALRQTHACSKSNASTAKPMAFAFSHTLATTSGTISPKTSGTLLLFLPSKFSSRHFSSQNISVKPHCPSLPSVCTVCVRVCACACACVRACVCVCIFCIIMLEHLSIYPLFSSSSFLITFSISIYIMCVCLFSALGRRVGALQIIQT